jgi:CheY-like chemotaxis protein
MSSLRPPVALLVQPEHDDREMYTEFLTSRGVAAVPVSTARQAMTTAPDADVIITGVRLPGEIDGIDLIAWLRRDRRTKHLPIVVLTASGWGTERARAEAAGCDLFLLKPCLPCELLRHLRRLLARSGSRGE